ncbi:MAG TPA: HAD-IA family hydrolase [Methylomirabilota bacterium]|jgi:putative hydrolase of the HAD superfamily
MPLRAIFFDAGNTLIRMDYAAIARALDARGVRVSPVDVERADWRARVRLDPTLAGTGARVVSTETPDAAGRYLRFILEELGVRGEALVADLGAWRLAYNPPVGLWNVVEPDALAALRLVRQAGLSAAVISNSNGSVRSILEDLGLAAYLDFVLDSAEVGVEKPNARIFQMALERAGLGPGQAVYVGDLYSVDVLGARAAGLPAVLLDPGACWGGRDCTMASSVLHAVRLVMAGDHV